MDSGDLHELDARISALEAELQRLKTQRLAHLGQQPRPLDGIRVFDLSRLIFGPFCTQILADMGADVIKVEPHTGDQARRSGTVFINGESASFLARNRNKRSIILDLRQPAAQEIAHRLVQRSDILVHNFRPGVMARLGLDAKQVHALNPRLVYCSLTGYGQTGPRADWPGQDLLIQAMSGIISTTGWEDGPPVTVGTYIADMTGALTAVNAIMMALHACQQYGIGQEISVSLLDAMIAAQSMEATVYLNSGILPGKSRSGHWQASQPYAIFHTQDRDIAINAHSDDWWLRLCKAPEFAHLAHDARFATRQARSQHGDALLAALQPIFLTKTRDAWLDHLGAFDVLRAPVYNYAEVFTDPQVEHNAMVVEQQHSTAGPIKVINTPMKLSETPAQLGPAAPRLGEHTQEILEWLGYDAAHIERLRQERVV
jgi:crotonobetainyl-CoA:carnitine CoA-transferase CaiB-like acyl-CoA transferase